MDLVSTVTTQEFGNVVPDKRCFSATPHVLIDREERDVERNRPSLNGHREGFSSRLSDRQFAQFTRDEAGTGLPRSSAHREDGGWFQQREFRSKMPGHRVVDQRLLCAGAKIVEARSPFPPPLGEWPLHCLQEKQVFSHERPQRGIAVKIAWKPATKPLENAKQVFAKVIVLVGLPESFGHRRSLRDKYQATLMLRPPRTGRYSLRCHQRRITATDGTIVASPLTHRPEVF